MEERRDSFTPQAGQSKVAETPLVEVTRILHAPIERVFKACSNAESIMEWWGPEDYTSPKADIDFREGGKFLFGMKSPEGDVNWSVGTITSIVPNKRISFDETFGNEKGEPVTPSEAGIPNWSGDYHGNVTMYFEKLAEEQTKLFIRHKGIPAEMHDECVEGWKSSLNKLQKLVERH